MIQKVSIIGTGNVATHLAKALTEVGISITHVVSKNQDHALEFAKKTGAETTQLSTLPRQLTLVCVSDDVISDILHQIDPEIPTAYTSGSVALNQLPQRSRLGVFYPLQTFSKHVDVLMAEVPVLVESNNPDFLNELKELALLITPKVNEVNSEQRRKLHLAAVWINNFTNHIVYNAQEIAEEQGVDYQLLLPLLQETIRKLDYQTAREAQTGPARRGDQQTIEKHLSELEGTRKEIYRLLSESIKETYND